MFDLKGLFSGLCFLFFMGLALLALILKICGVLLVGWWVVVIILLIALFCLFLGAMGIG